MKNIFIGLFLLSNLSFIPPQKNTNTYLQKPINKSFNSKIESAIQNYSIAEINAFIYEAYADNFNFFLNDDKRYPLIVDFFQNRLSFVTSSKYEGKVFKNISDIDLDKKYNSNQQRDTSYDIQTFNPLKYKIEMFPQKTIVYKLGNSQYYMLIQPRR